MNHSYSVGDHVFLTSDANKLPESDWGGHTVSEIRDVPEVFKPHVQHHQWVILNNGHMYSGWYLQPKFPS